MSTVCRKSEDFVAIVPENSVLPATEIRPPHLAHLV
jgi:hypothetical protein